MPTSKRKGAGYARMSQIDYDPSAQLAVIAAAAVSMGCAFRIDGRDFGHVARGVEGSHGARRVSVYVRTAQGHGARDQMAVAARVAKNLGYRVDAYHSDVGVSGIRPGGGPELGALMGRVRAGEVDVIVVADVDRISRDAGTVRAVLDECRSHDVEVVDGTGSRVVEVVVVRASKRRSRSRRR